MKYACLALLVAAAGCTKPNPASCLEDNFCSDPSLPYCDKTGSVGGTAGACVAVTCTPGEVLECEDDMTATTCVQGGDNYSPVPCPYGCGAGGCQACNTAECEKHLVPKYLPSVCDQVTTLPALSITVDTTFDTSVASKCTAVVTQLAGPEICVVRAPTITVEAQKTLKVVGSRVLALVADRDLRIAGTLDISADNVISGPGGGTRKSGSPPPVSSLQGGGGAGHRSRGAGGAAATTDLQNGGAAELSPAMLDSLFGGPQPTMGSQGRAPGGGGGGVTLISCRALASVSGVVDAGGGGGEGSVYDISTNPALHFSSAGGGAGGTITVQGITVSITGAMYANGGAGGGGAGNPGEDAPRSTTLVAQGGSSTIGGAGGNGGSVALPTPGNRKQGAASCGDGCGAGGASAGFIITFTPPGSTPTTAGATFSPALEPNVTIPTN